MAKCPKCGTDNEVDSKFCKNCGSSLSSNDETPKNGVEKKNQSTNGIYLIIGIVIVIAIIAIAAFTIFNGSTSEEINGITFHIPNDYNLSDVESNNPIGFSKIKSTTKLYTNDAGEIIRINVINTKGEYNMTEDDILSFFYNEGIDYTEKTIKGHHGFEVSATDDTPGFVFVENNKAVLLLSTDESLINGILP